MKKILPILSAFLCIVSCQKPQAVEEEPSMIFSVPKALQLVKDQEEQLSIQVKYNTGRTEAYNIKQNELGLTFESSDASVLTVSASGMVKALKRGSANISVASRTTPKLKCSVVCTVTRGDAPMYDLSRTWSDDMAFYCFREGGADSQCFDIDSKGNIYYACTKIRGQVGYLTIVRFSPDGKKRDEMPLYYMGHGTAFSVEEDGDDTYIWTSGCGSVNSDGRGYGSCTIACRIKFEPGVGKTPEDLGSSSFYISGKKSLDVSRDKETGHIAILYYDGSNLVVNEYTKDALFGTALKEVAITVTRGSSPTGQISDATSKRISLELHDISSLTPLHKVTIAKSKAFGTRADNGSTKSNQGFCFYDGCFYFMGDSDRNKRDVTITCVKTDGTTVHNATHIAAVDDNAARVKLGFGVSSGYYESEGLQFCDDALHVGFLCWDDKGICYNSILRLK